MQTFRLKYHKILNFYGRKAKISLFSSKLQRVKLHSLAAALDENKKNFDEKLDKLLRNVESAMENRQNFERNGFEEATNLKLPFFKHLHKTEANERLERIYALKKQRDECLESLRELNRMISGPGVTSSSDEELKRLAEIDAENVSGDKQRIDNDILDQLLLPDSSIEEQAGVVLSATSGAGGEESMLFAKELFQMYELYARYKMWTFEIEHFNTDSSYGGIHSASASVIGQDAFKCFRFESGVHRVQRVPVTERGGRIHTSTASITVTPLPRKIDVQISQKDIRVDKFRSSGHGGQNAQMNESAIRVTHKPTGIVCECEQSRNQSQNLEIAMDRLKSKLYQLRFEKEVGNLEKSRKLQMGSRERSEKIRTYNFVDNRITDHRIKQNFHNIPEIMTGNGQAFDQIVVALLEFNRNERLLELLNCVE